MCMCKCVCYAIRENIVKVDGRIGSFKKIIYICLYQYASVRELRYITRWRLASLKRRGEEFGGRSL